MGTVKVDYAYVADLDDTQVIEAFERIDQQALRLETLLNSVFQQVEKVGKKSFKALERNAKNSLKAINTEFATIGKSLENFKSLPSVKGNIYQSFGGSSEEEKALRIEQQLIALQREMILLQSQELALDQQIAVAKERSRIAAQTALSTEISRYPQLRQQLNALAQEYGEFTAVLGRNEAELNKEEKEVNDLIKKYPQLATRIDQLTKEYGELNLQIAKTPAETNRAGKGAAGFATKLGLVTSASFLVTSALRNMARTAVETLKTIVNQSVTTAQQFDLVRISLQGILETDDTARVERLFTSIRASSRDLGTNVADIANAFLPLLDNIGQLERAGEAVSELIQLSIVGGKQQTQGDAIRAIAEGFSGDFISIRRLFELTPGEIDKIRDTYRELGTEGFLDALDEVLTARGISLDKFRGTTQFVFSQIREYARDLQNEFGTPIDEALLVFLEGIRNFAEVNFDDILALSEAFGELIANLVTDSGETILDKLNSVDFDEIFDNVKELNEALDRLQFLLDIFKVNEENGLDIGFQFGNLSILPDMLGDFNTEIERLNTLLTTMQQITIVLGGVLSGWGAAVQQGVENVSDVLKGNITRQEAELRVTIAREEAFNKAVAEGTAKLNQQTDAIEERNAAIDESRQGQGGGQTDIDIAQFAIDQLPERLAAQDAIIAENEAKIAERTAEVDLEIYRKRLENRKDFLEKQFDLEIDFAREREDLETKILRQIEDAEDDAVKDRRDSAIDFQRDIEDINDKANQKLVDVEKESANDRIDVERDLQEKLKELRRDFLFDAEEAIRQNDALAFLRLQRKYEFELNEAKLKAKEERENAVDEEKQKRAEIETERQEQIRQAQIDRDRDLADLRTKLDDELAEIRKTRDRDLADQRLSEERRLADRDLYHQRQKEEFDIYQKEKLEDLAIANADETAVIAQAQADRLKIEADGYEASLVLQNKYIKARIAQDQKAQQFLATSGYGQVPGGSSPVTPDEQLAKQAKEIGNNVLKLAYQKGLINTELANKVQSLIDAKSVNKLLTLYNELRKLKDGGRVRAYESVIVGDGGDGSGAEIFTPDRPGTVTPLDKILNPYLTQNSGGFYLPPPGAGNRVDQSKNYNIDLSMLDPNNLSPAQIMIMVEVAKQVVSEVFAS